MQLILVSGLSGSGKSIALNVLEDGGYYCVDNLPATLLLQVADFLQDAGHERVAVSVDARSAALPALPENVSQLKARGIDCRVLFLEAGAQTLLRRFSETRRRHPLTVAGLTLAEAIERERTLLAGVADLGHRIDTSELLPRALQGWIKELVGLGGGALTLLFESFAFRDGIPLDADWVIDARMLPNPHYDAALRPLTGRDAPVASYLGGQEAVQRPDRRRAGVPCALAARNRARAAQLRHRGDRLHRRAAQVGVPGRTPGGGVPRRLAGAGAAPRPGAHRSGGPALSAAGLREIALFPLRAVLFPGGLLPLRVFEQRYMDMATDCLREDRPFGVCLIRSGTEVGPAAMPEQTGCLARISQWDMQQLGVLHIVARGEERFRIARREVLASGLTRAEVELLPADDDCALPDEFLACARLLRLVIEEHGAQQIEAPFRFDSSSWVGSRLAEILPVPLAAKQKLMELSDARERLEILHKYLVQHGLVTRA